MEIGAHHLTVAWMLSGALATACALAAACRGAPWSWLRRTAAAPRLLTSLLALLVVWQIRTRLGDAPAYHLLGATLLTLAFGWRLALLGLLAVLIAATPLTRGDWAAVGVNAQINVVLPVALSYAWARGIERVLPSHLFVYVFVSGFFGAALAMAGAALAAAAVLYLAGAVSTFALTSNYLPTAVLLLFPEAFTTGALLTLAAVYRPSWLASFDTARYLR